MAEFNGERWVVEMKQVKWLVCVLIVLSMVQPALAWGTITHVKMSAEAGNPYPGYKMEYLSGSIAPDAGYAISNEWGYKFHGDDVSKALRIADTMFNLADSNGHLPRVGLHTSCRTG